MCMSVCMCPVYVLVSLRQYMFLLCMCRWQGVQSDPHTVSVPAGFQFVLLLYDTE